MRVELILSSIAAVTILSCCNEKEKKESVPVLEVSKGNIDVAGDMASEKISITSNRAWHVEASEPVSWISVDPEQGGRPVLLVCNARGGTTIQEWAVGTQYYNEAVRRTLAAMQYGRLKGILWHQGCGNSGAVTNGTIDYLALLKTMADTMRS